MWREGPAVRGLLKIALLCWWVGISVLLGFALWPIFGWIAVYGWLGGNIFVMYMLNQSRKHFKGNVIDDRLSTDRMSVGEERYIKDALQRREDDTQQERQKTPNKN
jgi:hypothetical protein